MNVFFPQSVVSIRSVEVPRKDTHAERSAVSPSCRISQDHRMLSPDAGMRPQVRKYK